MPDYWLDSDVLIRAKNEYYAFDFAKHFWQFLEQNGKEGVVASCRAVYRELLKHEDELRDWAMRQNENGFFWEPDQRVQDKNGEIGDYVRGRFPPHNYAPFLGGADAWVIAQACVHGGVVVSNETSAPFGKRPKVPDIAHHFHVLTPDLYTVLRDLHFQFPTS